MQNQTLTKSEMTVMNILWEMPDGGTVYDVLAKYEEPKPAYTTTATFMKILEKKGYYVDQYIDKYPKAKNGVVMIDSFMKNSSLFVIDGEPMNFQTMRQKYPEGLPPTKYHINHKDAKTIAKYSQYPEAKNGVNIIITGKE